MNSANKKFDWIDGSLYPEQPVPEKILTLPDESNMQNIEIKATYPNLDEGRKLALEIGAKLECTLHQMDTYFHVKKGRLKLREISSQEAQLIFYERPNESGPKTSIYHIYPVHDASLLKSMLDSALGIWKIVQKKREVYWFDEVRIHLDRVTDLGNFLEFEGLIQNCSQKRKVQETVAMLISHFCIPSENLIAASYSDLIGI